MTAARRHSHITLIAITVALVGSGVGAPSARGQTLPPAPAPAASTVAPAATPSTPAHPQRSTSVAALPQVDHLAPTPRAAAAAPEHHAPRIDPAAYKVIEQPLFGPITLYAPRDKPRALALFLSGDGGWNLGVWSMAQEAAAQGMWVAGFSTPDYLRALDHDAADTCSDAAGTLSDLADTLKKKLALPTNLPVLMIGYSSGATVVYAALVQARPDTFEGGVSLGFCPDLVFHKPFCPGIGDLAWTRADKPPHTPSFTRNNHVAAPWTVLQGTIDEVCAPHFTPDFVTGVAGARGVLLPHVGHGFGVPRNWMPQYRQALDQLLQESDASSTAGLTAPAKR